MIFKSIFLIALLITLAFGSTIHPHDHFVQMQICEKISEHKYDKYNSGMKLKCEWSKFLDENNKLVNSKQSYRDSEYIYEIVFTPSPVPGEIEKYKVINAGLFANFRLKSVSFQNLGIITVEEGAFDKFCCQKTLATLDLSKNYMIRLDADSLKDLNRLTRLNLASNHLSLTEHNFKYLKNLRYIDLSNNNLQYLPSSLFAGIGELELVNLSENNLQSVSACVFDQVQVSPVARKLFPTKIDLTINPINCDCNVFYLARHKNYKVEATCHSPKFYEGKPFKTLKDEDPSSRCEYSKMEATCSNTFTSEALICSVVVLAVLSGLFLLCTLVCCCKYMSASDRADKFQRELTRVRSAPIIKSDSQHADLSVASSDKQKLLA